MPTQQQPGPGTGMGDRAERAVTRANPFTLLHTTGVVHQPDTAVRYFLRQVCGEEFDAAALQDSWNRLQQDAYMKDGGTYRFRRFTTLETCLANGELFQTEPRPHFQKLDHNVENGGIDRWYPDLEQAVLNSDLMRAIVEAFRAVCELVSPTRRWRIEMHQFRINAEAGKLGKPTPEGRHRDGVDFVLIMLINRVNVTGGDTVITDVAGNVLAELTMTKPFESVLLNDETVRHEVSAITPVDPTKPAYRDTLVITARALA